MYIYIFVLIVRLEKRSEERVTVEIRAPHRYTDLWVEANGAARKAKSRKYMARPRQLDIETTEYLDMSDVHRVTLA